MVLNFQTLFMIRTNQTLIMIPNQSVCNQREPRKQLEDGRLDRLDCTSHTVKVAEERRQLEKSVSIVAASSASIPSDIFMW